MYNDFGIWLLPQSFISLPLFTYGNLSFPTVSSLFVRLLSHLSPPLLCRVFWVKSGFSFTLFHQFLFSKLTFWCHTTPPPWHWFKGNSVHALMISVIFQLLGSSPVTHFTVQYIHIYKICQAIFYCCIVYSPNSCHLHSSVCIVQMWSHLWMSVWKSCLACTCGQSTAILPPPLSQCSNTTISISTTLVSFFGWGVCGRVMVGTAAEVCSSIHWFCANAPQLWSMGRWWGGAGRWGGWNAAVAGCCWPLGRRN